MLVAMKSARAESVDREVLKRLVPPNPLSWSEFCALAEGQAVELVRPGEALIADPAERQHVYLLKGEVNVSADGGQKLVKAGSAEARQAFGVETRAVAHSAANVLRVKQSQVDAMAVDGDSSSIHVRDLNESSLDETGDWMTKIVQSAAFRQLPPAKIHALLLRLEELAVRTGQTVMRQGEVGDSYYIILRGECEVSRENTSGTKLTLARLGKGQTFGEEALLSSAPRNATVQMVTDGLLMRLPKRDFDELIRDSLLQEIGSEETVKLRDEGAQLLDVRAFDPSSDDAIPGSINIPLYMLRMKVPELEPERAYVCYCENECESVVAAFLLSAWGLNAYLLRGGLQAYDQTDPMFAAAG